MGRQHGSSLVLRIPRGIVAAASPAAREVVLQYWPSLACALHLADGVAQPPRPHDDLHLERVPLQTPAPQLWPCTYSFQMPTASVVDQCSGSVTCAGHWHTLQCRELV